MSKITQVSREQTVVHLKDQPHRRQSQRKRPLADPWWGNGHEPAQQTPVRQEENTKAAPAMCSTTLTLPSQDAFQGLPVTLWSRLFSNPKHHSLEIIHSALTPCLFNKLLLFIPWQTPWGLGGRRGSKELVAAVRHVCSLTWVKQLGPGAQDQGQMKFTYRAQNREWLVLKGDSEGGRRKVQQNTGSSQHRDTGKEGQVPEFCDCITQESPPPPICKCVHTSPLMHEERFAIRPAALATGSLQESSCTITLGDLLSVLPLTLRRKDTGFYLWLNTLELTIKCILFLDPSSRCS